MELKHLNWIISRESSQWSAAQKFSCVLALQRIVFVDKMFISEIKSATAYTKKKKMTQFMKMARRKLLLAGSLERSTFV